MLVVTTALVDAIKRWRESALDSLDEFGDTSTDDDNDEDFNFLKDSTSLSSVARMALELQLELQKLVVTSQHPHKQHGRTKRACLGTRSSFNFLSLPRNVTICCLSFLSGRDICTTDCLSKAFHPVGLTMGVAMANTPRGRRGDKTSAILSKIRTLRCGNWGCYIDHV